MTIEKNKLYKESEKIEKNKKKRIENIKKYYHCVFEKQKQRLEEKIGKKIDRKISKIEKQSKDKLIIIKKKLKGKEIKVKSITVNKYISNLRPLFSLYIRLRDSLFTTYKYDQCRCITCGKLFDTWKHIQAGHCIGRTNKRLLFNIFNVHGQCQGCNKNQHIQYGSKGFPEIFLKKIEIRYGKEKVNELLLYKDEKTYKYTIGELELIEIFLKEGLKKMKVEKIINIVGENIKKTIKMIIENKTFKY